VQKKTHDRVPAVGACRNSHFRVDKRQRRRYLRRRPEL